ncbi:MAG: amidase [SAR202 cluster bacterium]|nr:amidase [SAR202 cluster bacterium]
MQPYELTVAESAALIARKKLSPVELMESLLSRSRALEPKLRVWVTLDEGAAMAAARRAEAAVTGGKKLGPLHGVPFGIKDIFYTKGVRTTMGSPIYADFVPDHDSAAWARLKRAGAVGIGKTVTTEFACYDPPPTRNPWNAARTPGGSSSGSAAGVAAKMFPAALGSQTGGSVVRPAAYCGVVGLKPTYGLISRYGVMGLAPSLDTMGHFTRTVEDAALLLAAMAGYDRRDPASVRRPAEDYMAPFKARRARAPRIGVLKGYFSERATQHVRDHTAGIVERMAGSGAVVEEATVGADFETLAAGHKVIMGAEVAATHERDYAARPGDYGPKMRALVESGMVIPAASYIQSLRYRQHFIQVISETLAKYDALLTPTTPAPAPGPETTGDGSFQIVWSALGLPTVTMPSGLDPDGLPLGIQVIAGEFEETKLLSAARWCEATLGVKMSPPV